MKLRELVCVGACAAAFACGGDGGNGAGPEESAARVQNLSVVLGAAYDSMAFLETSEVLTSLDTALPGTSTTTPAVFLAEPASGDPAAEIEEFLTTIVFTDDQYEGNGYYLLSGVGLCDELDEPCFADFEAAKIRVRAVEVGASGLDVSIHAGPGKDQLIAFELREDSLAVVVDLAQAAAGIDYLATTFGESVDLPETLEGVIAASVTVDGPEAATIDYAVREDVAVVAMLPNMGGTLSFSQAAKDPVFSLSADAIAETLALALDVGATTFSVPYTAINDLSVNSELFAIAIQGMSGSVSLSEGDMELTIANIAFGAGASTVSLGSDVLLSFLHNDGLGAMSMTVSAANPDAPIFEFAPGLTLEIGTHLAPLLAEGEDIPDYFLDETYSLELTGSAPAVTAVPAGVDHDGGLMVTGGSLVLATDSDAGATVTVADGDCLLPVAVPAIDAHGILGEVTSGVCP